MIKKQYFYFYKITNEINGMCYYGVHSTYKLDDGYMGSGYYLKSAQEKYGINNFKKEILHFFESRDEMMNYEAKIVNTQMIHKNNPMCYNLVRGGWGSHAEVISINTKGRKLPREIVEKARRIKIERGTYKKISEENMGYNNPEFLYVWKEIYEKDMDKIVNLILSTDLSDDFIVKNIFNKKVKTYRLIEYYEYLGLLINKTEKEMKNRWTNKNKIGNLLHLSSRSLKSIYANSNIVPTAIYLPEYFNEIPNILKIIEDDTISDSMIINSDKNKSIQYHDVIRYLEYIGILRIANIKTIKVMLERNVNNTVKKILRKSTKTKYTFSYENAKNTILFDEEMNTYGINVNGEVIRTGRFC